MLIDIARFFLLLVAVVLLVLYVPLHLLDRGLSAALDGLEEFMEELVK